MLKTLEEAGEKVDSLVRETFENGKLADFLDTMAKLPNISYGNCLLLKSQLEDVSKVLPKDIWKQYRKNVDEKAEPLKIIKYDKNNQETGYILADVYDVSQTDSNKKEKSYNKEFLENIMNNMQKKLDQKYKLEFKKEENIGETIRHIIFNMNDFSGNSSAVDFIDSIRLIVEPSVYTIQKRFGLETTNNDEINNICIWGVDQANDTLKQGLKDIQRTVNSFVKDFEREQKKYLINMNYKNQEQENN